MDSYNILIPGKYPGMNEFISAGNENRYVAANMKKNNQRIIELYLIKQLKDVQIPCKIDIKYHFFEADQKRDKDNVSGFFHKIFQDALVNTGIIPNDGWKWINSFADTFDVDKGFPRVEILLEMAG